MEQKLFVPGMETWNMVEQAGEVVEGAKDAVTTFHEAEKTGVAIVIDDGIDLVMLKIAHNDTALVIVLFLFVLCS